MVAGGGGGWAAARLRLATETAQWGGGAAGGEGDPPKGTVPKRWRKCRRSYLCPSNLASVALTVKFACSVTAAVIHHECPAAAEPLTMPITTITPLAAAAPNHLT